MNIVLLVTIVLLIIKILDGYNKGMVKEIISLISLAITCIVVVIVGAGLHFVKSSQIAGVLVAVLTFMGIKYITSGPEAQGKLKQQLIGVVVSGVVIFGAYGIWQLVGKIVSTF